ncbi:chloramphenicol acetyltransferase [Sediminitomix flava]|uniref:Chloramphenicol O-acetyltransferase type A n=1 Tax=Sediminitomix flava TaxID=379075 RepID=A0A315Z928_SEDFL|nr:chloramphenicol acetyltransferase [Sediminitomix flava]PWJ42076.1 chloramphenicol O-acetyltransferase type A [Sediminitomix flava]
MKKLDLKNWNRREHFEFFSKFDEPFWGLVADVDCTKAYELSKKEGYSFFAYYLYQALRAANQVEEFKYRIQEGEVFVCDQINASPTIGRADHTFGFSFIKFQESFVEFEKNLKEEVENVQNSEGLRLSEETGRIDVIHFSSIPWSSFTSLSHARNFQYADCVPKITFGKTLNKHGKMILPLSIHVHHGLADGYHVGKFLEIFQKCLDEA